MVTKMLGTSYVFDPRDGKMNLFDAVITVGSLIDYVVADVTRTADCYMPPTYDDDDGAEGDDDAASANTGSHHVHVFKIGRTLRLVRVLRSLRMVRRWKSMAHILGAVARSGPGLVNFSCLLLLFSFVYALAGMQMYAGKFKIRIGSHKIAPRTNFDSLGEALLTVFVVVSGENWDGVLDLAFRANGYLGLLFVAALTRCFIDCYLSLLNTLGPTMICGSNSSI